MSVHASVRKPSWRTARLLSTTKEKSMKAILNGVIVCLITIALFAVSMKAKAGELERHLEGKKVVYIGVCWMDQNGILTFDDKQKKQVIKCVVGMEPNDTTKHYVLVFKNDKPSKLIMFDEKTKEQVTLWVGNSV